jgi:hypothetical protein
MHQQTTLTLCAHTYPHSGCKINQQNVNGETPLHKTVLNARSTIRVPVMTTLLNNNADVKLTTTRGASPLHYAVEMRREDVILALLANGADVAAKDNNGNTPLSMATQTSAKATLRLIREVADLRQFFDDSNGGCGLPQYFRNFAYEEVFGDVFSELNEQVLEQLGVKIFGHKIKILNAVKNREKQQQQQRQAGTN